MDRLGKIIYDAITADSALMQTVGNRVKSTCFEVSPTEKDNTQLPYLIVMDGDVFPSQTTKDDGWMPSTFTQPVSIEIGANSSNEVWDLMFAIMQAIANYIEQLAEDGHRVPYLLPGFPKANEKIAWDWTKPCYFNTVYYAADIDNTNNDEQEG